MHEFLEQVKAGGEIGYAESGGENAVRVMTMHASKGLEFPVVIVGGLNKPFAGDQSPVLFDDEWGFALKAYDPSSHTAAETILRAAASRRAARRRSEDEMRLLYVALTRAKSSLHLVFSKEQPFDEASLTEAKSFADFIDLSLLKTTTPRGGHGARPCGRAGHFRLRRSRQSRRAGALRPPVRLSEQHPSARQDLAFRHLQALRAKSPPSAAKSTPPMPTRRTARHTTPFWNAPTFPPL